MSENQQASENATTLEDLYEMSSRQGVVTADTDKVIGIVSQDLKDLLGLDSIVPETPLGRLIEWFGVAFANVLRINAQNANQLLVSHAAGQQLDAMGYLFGVSRKAATHTEVNVVLQGAVSKTIPKGARAKTEDGVIFALTDAVTLDGSGTAEGLMRAVVAGETYCPAGALCLMDSSVEGWSSVNNPKDAIQVGTFVETDAAYRARIEECRHSNTGYIGAMRSAIDSIKGVVSSMVVENNKGTEETIRGIVVPAHSIAVCVCCEGSSGSDSDSEGQTDVYTKVAEAVFRNKPLGCGFATGGENGTVCTVQDDYGNTYEVPLLTPDAANVSATVSVRKSGYTGVSLQSDVKKAAAEWLTDNYGGKIGVTISGTELAAGIESAVPGVLVRSVSFAAGSSSVGYLELDANKMLAVSEGGITVQVS